jgi:t-SNARE complex subunit (syntaxin)
MESLDFAAAGADNGDGECGLLFVIVILVIVLLVEVVFEVVFDVVVRA